jgi:hypothetical protein
MRILYTYGEFIWVNTKDIPLQNQWQQKKKVWCEAAGWNLAETF